MFSTRSSIVEVSVLALIVLTLIPLAASAAGEIPPVLPNDNRRAAGTNHEARSR